MRSRSPTDDGDARPVAVFRCDADANIGMGHLRRSLTLAGALAGRGWRCVVAVAAPSPSVAARIGAGHGLAALDPEDWDRPEALVQGWLVGADLAVVDHYGLDERYERALSGWAGRVLVIDDLADRRHACDFLLDSSPDRAPREYRRLVGDEPLLLLGPQFALLDPRFAAKRSEGPELREDGPARLLISLGATDPPNLTERALDAVARLTVPVTVDCVLGAAAPHLAGARAAAAASPVPVRLHVDSDDMPDLMAAATLAIGAPGTTAWERCSLGLPSVTIATAANQLGIAAALDRRGAARHLGWHADVTAGDIQRACEELLADPPGLSEMAARAAALCDGWGAERVADLVAMPGSASRD